MTEAELLHRLTLATIALESADPKPPESIPVQVSKTSSGAQFFHDFRGDEPEEKCYLAIMSIVEMIIGLRDRTKRWLKKNSRDVDVVDMFIKSHLHVALVHDLGNLDKHGSVGRTPFSGKQIKLEEVGRAMVLKYDPVTQLFAKHGEFVGQTFDPITGQLYGKATSSNVEVTLVGTILDENGDFISQIPRTLPQALYDWEQFLISLGVPIPKY